MNRKQFIILVVLVVALGIAGLLLYQRNQSSWQGSGRQGAAQKLLGDLPVNDVAAIVIKGGTNQLDLVKKDNLWRVKERDDYPANFTEISGFLLKALDLKAAQSEEIGPSQLGRYKLLPPGPATNTAVLVELRDQNGKVIKSLLLGKTHMRKSEGRPSPMGEMGDNEGFPDGRYVMVGTGAKTRSQARPVAQQGLLQGGEDPLDCRHASGGDELVEGKPRYRNRQRLEAGRCQARRKARFHQDLRLLLRP